MFICFVMFLCIDSFIDSFIVGINFIFMFICSFVFVCIETLIAGKTMGNLRNRRTLDL